MSGNVLVAKAQEIREQAQRRVLFLDFEMKERLVKL